jgi:WD40 repeat protein
VRSVAFSPDGKTIVSGSDDWTIKVWDAANPRPYNAAEWEKVEGDGEEYYDEEADMNYPYWKNTVTGELRQEESTAGVSPSNRSKSGMQVP